MKISVLIPTYNSVDSLDLCLKSAILGCSNLGNVEIIVGDDSGNNTNKHVLDKYKDNIKVLSVPENIGLPRMTNYLVYNSSYENVLIVNDDNIFPSHYDRHLLKLDTINCLWTPNQIEPFPSMFEQFTIRDLGRDPKIFDLEYFWTVERCEIWKDKIDETGSTLPIYMSRKNFIKIGGWNELYPITGIVADWDFFLKCQMNGLKMMRTYQCNFYHFVSLSAKTPKQIQERQKQEIEAHELAKFIWGDYIKHNPKTNLKYL